MSKIIDITSRLKTVHSSSQSMTDESSPKLLQIDEFKSKFKPVLLKERRQVERTILSDLISGMVVLPEKGLCKVSLYDISNEGLAFTLDKEMGSFQPGEEIALRVYLNRKTYFPLHVKVKHATFDIDEDVIRHGVEYIVGSSNDVALQHFVNFIISLNEGLKIDDGDLIAGTHLS